jgi:hypothetical protein
MITKTAVAIRKPLLFLMLALIALTSFSQDDLIIDGVPAVCF